MTSLRENPPESMAGLSINKIEDYETGLSISPESQKKQHQLIFRRQMS